MNCKTTPCRQQTIISYRQKISKTCNYLRFLQHCSADGNGLHGGMTKEEISRLNSPSIRILAGQLGPMLLPRGAPLATRLLALIGGSWTVLATYSVPTTLIPGLTSTIAAMPR